MGIDQVVRCVLIIGAPSSIEEYYQMIGRAGRDKLQADTVLFFQYKNIVIGKSMYDKNSNMDKQIVKSKKRCLDIMAKYFYNETCRRRYILEYFGQVPKFFTCKNCDNCCEKELKNYTKKIKKIIFENKKWTDYFSEDQINKLVSYDLIYKSNKKYYLKDALKNWKKIIEANNYIDNIPKKYKIKLLL